MQFYATIDCDSVRGGGIMPAVPMMLPASSWARKGLRAPNLPAHITETAADCGGFVATLKWGGYRYSPAQYSEWLHTFNPQWAATMDYCCEPEVAENAGIVAARQARTTGMAYRFWADYRDAPWCWVPTVQGWAIADYARHAQALAPLVAEMQAHYGAVSAFRVGIGTLCRRASPAMIRAVVQVVANELPGVPLHLWGVKLALFKGRTALHPAIASVDSAAWNGLFGKGIEDARRLYALGQTQRQVVYGRLPGYIERIETALAEPKQLELGLAA